MNNKIELQNYLEDLRLIYAEVLEWRDDVKITANMVKKKLKAGLTARNLLTPEEAVKKLYSKGYVHLKLGSYHKWIFKNWHEMFLKKRLITCNAYGMFVRYADTLSTFIHWMELYNAYKMAKDFPRSHKLTPEQADEIRAEGLFDTAKQLEIESNKAI